MQVLRGKPRPRDVINDLCGELHVLLEALTYLHVGFKQILLRVGEEHVKFALSRYQSIDERSVREVAFEEEYEPFSSLRGKPVIPASSIKGNVRSRLELSFRAKGGEVRSCFIRAGPPLPRSPRRGAQGWRHYSVWGRVLEEDRGGPCDLTKAPEVCLLCDLFGTAGLSSLVVFSDLVGEHVDLADLSLEYGVRLKTAKPGSVFTGSVAFSNLKPEELGLILLGMGVRDSHVGRPVLLGRMKYRGRLGKVRFSLRSLLLVGHSAPLSVAGLSLAPGGSAEGAELDRVAQALTSLALEHFRGEFEVVDEVGAIERLG